MYFIKRRIRPLFKKRVVHFIGDSHTEVFWHMEFSPFCFGRLLLKLKLFTEPQQRALPIPTAKPTPGNSLKITSQGSRKNDFVVFQLGEVDCGFAIWYRGRKA